MFLELGKFLIFIFDKGEDSIVAYKVDPPESDVVKDEGEASIDLKAMFALADLALARRF